MTFRRPHVIIVKCEKINISDYNTEIDVCELQSKAPVSQLVDAEVNSVVVIAVLAPNYILQVRICECHA